MANESVSSQSFYEPTNNYSEKKTQMLYKQIKMNLQDVQRLANAVNVDMKNVKKDLTVTKKLLDAIKSNTLH